MNRFSSRHEGDFDCLRGVQAAHARQKHVVSVDRLEEPSLACDEAIEGIRDSGGRSSFAAPRITCKSNVAGRIGRTAAVPARVDDCTAKAVERHRLSP